MPRVLERELMDDERQAAAYARADFRASNQRFVEGLSTDRLRAARAVADIGCGPGDIAISLARTSPAARIVAIDGSAPMLALARAATRAERLDRQIALVRCHVQALPFPAAAFDAVLSKDLLHHLPDPAVLWREIARIGKPGALVSVMDLVRPPSREAAWQIVEQTGASDEPLLRDDFFNSLCAAFTIDEVRAQIAAAGLDLEVEPAGDRHWLASRRAGPP